MTIFGDFGSRRAAPIEGSQWNVNGVKASMLAPAARQTFGCAEITIGARSMGAKVGAKSNPWQPVDGAMGPRRPDVDLPAYWPRNARAV
jgi:hypothetical protein